MHWKKEVTCFQKKSTKKFEKYRTALIKQQNGWLWVYVRLQSEEN